MSIPNLTEAQKRIHFCHRKRRNHLNLAELGLRTADLDAVPEFAQLTQLEFLDLTGNELTELPRGLSRFTQLRWLGLNFNRLASVGGVEWLHRLERLYLRDNRVISLPFAIGLLDRLVELDLTANPLGELPLSMGLLDALEHVALEDSQLIPDQRSAWKQKAWPSLKKHLRMTDSAITREMLAQHRERHACDGLEAAPTITFYAAKLILIGDKGHGKTCLQKALRGLQVTEKVGKDGDTFSESTEGMNRSLLRLDKNGRVLAQLDADAHVEPGRDGLDFHIWDMGGQHDYRHMHQMLFSPQAIYLAVMIPRGKDDADRGLHRWLELVQRRTQGNARVLVICTRGRQDASLKLEDLQREFPQLTFHGLHVVDSVKGTGIPKLRRELAGIVSDKKGPYAQRWQPGWAGVFQALQGHAEQYLSCDEVRGICDKHGIRDGDAQEIFIRTGHLIGTWLWREDTPAGKGVVVLKPEWLNRAVARVLDDEPARKAHGVIRLDHLKKLWLAKARDGAQPFPAETHNMLLQLMEINELAYRPKRPGQKHGEGDLLLMTQMVQELPPTRLDEVWPVETPQNYRESRRTILFADQSGSLQPGEVPELIYLLIFRLRSLSLGHTNPDEAIHWQHGLVVSDKNHSMARIELKERELHIKLRYLRNDSLFDLIDHQIGADTDECWNGLKKTRYLSCSTACRQPRHDMMNGQGRISEDACHENLKEGFPAVNCASCNKPVKLEALFAECATQQVTLLDSRITTLIEQMAEGGTDWQRTVSGKLDHIAEVVTTIRDEARAHAKDWMNAFSNREDDRPRLFSILPVEKEWWKTGLMETEVDITIWCEWSLAPVPFFGEKYGKDGRGTLRVKVGREWVKHAKRAMQFTKFALLAWKTGGLAAGEYVLPAEWKPKVDEWSKTQADFEKALQDDTNKELRAYLKQADEADVEAGIFSKLGVAGYGLPKEQDAKFIHTMRELFVKHDSEWGGLKPVLEESRWYRVHPKWQQFGRKV
ncbi:Ras of Complex, Roc, domain of DAPkinase [Prosthecobacter debontii]|uniref:Ras of Complex, Roc, domain of DAPkinase n=1 Tax=Prosthecobacter debontii TaxID=48467 RepID=A0A1T4YIS0_9BACT|nr:COR domain-containing protein [Prosthecobacter debontii]SKB01155.1 Ras of Complex, Roc, domain of DAPkinase [Prosthecobacter debontii]